MAQPSMNNSSAPRWTKLYASAWRARAYFIAGIVFLIAHTIVGKGPFGQLPTNAWWQDLVDKGAGSFDKIGYALLIGGLVYAIASDLLEHIWNNNMQPEVVSAVEKTGDAFKKGLVDFRHGMDSLSFESVHSWIYAHRDQFEQNRALATAVLNNLYLKQNDEAKGVRDFVMDEMVHRYSDLNAIIWNDFFININIKPSTIPGHFEWNEWRTYTVVKASSAGTIPIRAELAFQLREAEFFSAMDLIQLTIKCGNEEIVNVKEWWLKNKQDYTSVPFSTKRDKTGLELSYNGIFCKISVTRDVIATDEYTIVTINEKSIVSTDDRCYSVGIRWPVRNLRISADASALDNWVIKRPSFAANVYQKEGKAITIEDHQDSHCQSHMPGWVLPGIVAVIEWAPKN